MKFKPRPSKPARLENLKVLFADHKIVMRPVSELHIPNDNPRKYTEEEAMRTAAAIREVGCFLTVLVDKNSRVLAGELVVKAAMLLGAQQVPTIGLTELSERDAEALRIMHSKVHTYGYWHAATLASKIDYLVKFDFNIGSLGFKGGEMDLIINPPGEAAPTEKEEAPEPLAGPAVTKPGDVVILGRHRLICASALEPATYQKLMSAEKAILIFTDPPFNVKIDGHVCGNGKIRHREFAMAAGEMTEDEFIAFLSQVIMLMCQYSTNGSIHYICMDWRHIGDLLEAARQHYTEYKQLIVWNKDVGGQGACYRSKHELIGMFKNGADKYINNFGLGETGRYRTNVWDYPGVNSMRGGRRDELAWHPTVKPLALVVDALLDCSNPGNIVLDPFMGSGTTLIAAEKTGRVCRGCELDPLYVDVAVRRWQALTGKKAVFEGSGLTFDEVAARLEVPDDQTV